MSATLVAKDLSGGHGHRVLFEGLDLVVAPDVIGVVGANGAGKSTLLSLLGGEEELLRLRERADDAGVTVPRLLLESALGAGGGAVPELRAIGKQLMAAHRDISGAAVNLNQIAKKANTTHEIPTDFDAAVRELRATHLLLTQATNAVIEALSGTRAGGTAQPGGEPVDREVGEG